MHKFFMSNFKFFYSCFLFTLLALLQLWHYPDVPKPPAGYGWYTTVPADNKTDQFRCHLEIEYRSCSPYRRLIHEAVSNWVSLFEPEPTSAAAVALMSKITQQNLPNCINKTAFLGTNLLLLPILGGS